MPPASLPRLSIESAIMWAMPSITRRSFSWILLLNTIVNGISYLDDMVNATLDNVQSVEVSEVSGSKTDISLQCCQAYPFYDSCILRLLEQSFVVS